MFLFHHGCSAVLSRLNGKGQVTLEVLCQGLQVLTKAIGKLVLYDMNSSNTTNIPQKYASTFYSSSFWY